MKKLAILFLFVFSVLGFTTLKKDGKKSFEKFLKNKSSYAFIPSGKAFVDGKEETVQSFYISKGEVSNFHYLEFLNYLEKNKETEKLKICQLDTMNWSAGSFGNSNYSEHYHDHPAYRNYPVVNVSHEAAQLYCEFVGKALAEKFSGVVVQVRLPQYAEFVRAARGEDPNMRYAWNSNQTRNKMGQILGNFTQIGEECISKNPETGKYEVNLKGISPIADGAKAVDVLAPSESYWPNQFDVYNLSGNAAEMINIPGVACGGAWNTPGYDARIEAKREFLGSDVAVGFRVVFTYLQR